MTQKFDWLPNKKHYTCSGDILVIISSQVCAIFHVWETKNEKKRTEWKSCVLDDLML